MELEQENFSFYREIGRCEDNVEILKRVQNDILDNRNKLTKKQVADLLKWTISLSEKWDVLKQDIQKTQEEEEKPNYDWQ